MLDFAKSSSVFCTALGVGRVYMHYFSGCASQMDLCTPAKTPQETLVALEANKKARAMLHEAGFADGYRNRARQLRCLRIAHG